MIQNRNLFLVAAMFGAVVASTGTAMAQQYWKFQDGNVSMRFETETIKLSGVTVSGVSELDSATSFQIGGPAWKLNMPGTSFGFVTQHSQFDRYETGEIQAKGGFSLNYKGRSIDFRGFRIIPTKETGSANFKILADVGSQAALPLELDAQRPIIQFDPKTRIFELVGLGLTISSAMAQELRAPELNGLYLGLMTVSGTVRLASGPSWDPFVETPDNGAANGRAAGLDVGICRLYLLTSVGRESIGGVFYNGFAANTTSINHGTVNAIAWKSTGTSLGANLPPEHPVIGINMFRTSNGRFEQIGEGWLKHGWAATNSTECPTTCSGSGSGAALGIGCTDTYSSGHNSDRNYLGPKSEVNPYTGVWTPEGSWFSQGVMDRVRRITGSQRRDPVTNVVTTYTPTATEHRMRVADSDLQVAGAQFIYEGFYIAGYVHSNNTATGAIVAAIDNNKYNNYAYRYTTPTWNGSSWTVADGATLYNGPAINSWGDSRSTGEPRLVGDLITAVKTTDIGGGWYFYDYAVYNLDLDRQVDAYFVSVADSVNVRNITFRDIDLDGTNQWTVSRSNGNIRWTMPASPVNALSYGRMFNFRFEAQVPPVPGFAQADMIKPGSFPWLTMPITGPTPSVRPVNGILTIPGRGTGAPTNVNVRLTPVGSGTVTNVNGVSVNMPSGAFAAQTTVRGQYNVSVAGAPFLRKNFGTVVNMGPDGSDISVNLNLIAGDVDGSNEIDAVDIDAAIAQFGSLSSTPADVDGSGEVDAVDIDFIISNFGAVGDL